MLVVGGLEVVRRGPRNVNQLTIDVGLQMTQAVVPNPCPIRDWPHHREKEPHRSVRSYLEPVLPRQTSERKVVRVVTVNWTVADFLRSLPQRNCASGEMPSHEYSFTRDSLSVTVPRVQHPRCGMSVQFGTAQPRAGLHRSKGRVNASRAVVQSPRNHGQRGHAHDPSDDGLDVVALPYVVESGPAADNDSKRSAYPHTPTQRRPMSVVRHPASVLLARRSSGRGPHDYGGHNGPTSRDRASGGFLVAAVECFSALVLDVIRVGS